MHLDKPLQIPRRTILIPFRADATGLLAGPILPRLARQRLHGAVQGREQRGVGCRVGGFEAGGDARDVAGQRGEDVDFAGLGQDVGYGECGASIPASRIAAAGRLLVRAGALYGARVHRVLHLSRVSVAEAVDAEREDVCGAEGRCEGESGK